MRGSSRARLRAASWVLGWVLVVACGPDGTGRVDVPGQPGTTKNSAAVRAERRAYDGAPPTVPHGAFGIRCASCHNDVGMAVPDVGYAPPSPHALTAGMSAVSRCRQCHVEAGEAEPLVASSFEPLRQDLRRGGRLYPLAPPTMPHRTLMRENCVACHSGPAAREEIRTPHPERARCSQCHVAVTSSGRFAH